MSMWMWAGVALAGPGVRGVQVEPLVETRGLYRRRVALVVGIDDYPGVSFDLSHAVNDAQAVARVLDERYAFDEVVLLSQANSTKAGVWSALHHLAESHPDDAVLVFWAGHGVSATDEQGRPQGYLVPVDGDPSPRFHPEANLSMAELRRFLLEEVPARHKLVIADACYAGSLSTRGAVDPGATLSQLTQRPVLAVLTAGGADETVLDGGTGGHSVFTAALLDGLEDVDSYTTASALAATVQRAVREDAYALGHRQTPDFARVAGSGDFVLLPMGDPEATVPRIPKRRRGGSWGYAVPGIVFPEPGPPPTMTQRAGVSVQPQAARRVRVASASGVGVQQLDETGARVAAGLTTALATWRLDVDVGATAGLDAETPAGWSGAIALAPPPNGTGRTRMMVQPRASWATETGGDGVGMGVVVGGGTHLRWSLDAQAMWPQPGASTGVRWGSPTVGGVVAATARGDLRDSTVLAVPSVGVDWTARTGLRVVLLATYSMSGVSLEAGERAWLQDPDALTRVQTAAGGAPGVSGAGVVGQSVEGPGLFVAPAPGPGLRLVIARGGG